MKRQFVALFLLFFIVGAVNASDHDIRGRAETSAFSWLALTDGGQYAESWNNAASLLQEKTPKSEWSKKINKIRAPLGSVKSRNVATATYTESMSGAPDGRYIIFVFYTSFEQKGLAVETMTMTKEPDNKWRVLKFDIE